MFRGLFAEILKSAVNRIYRVRNMRGLPALLPWLLSKTIFLSSAERNRVNETPPSRLPVYLSFFALTRMALSETSAQKQIISSAIINL